MKAIIIGAGRGRRLRPHTDSVPKCLVEVGGRPILDWILDAISGAGVDDVVFIGGYRIDEIRSRRPELTYVVNDRWEENNILASLFYAREHMAGGFLTAYSDTILTPGLVRGLLDAPEGLCMSVDGAWNERHNDRPRRYEDDVEGVHVHEGWVCNIERIRPPGDAHGEFTGVLRVDGDDVDTFTRVHDECRAASDGGPFHHGRTFDKAYLVDLVRELIGRDQPVRAVDSRWSYLEIDTVEDYELANTRWVDRVLQERRDTEERS